MSFDVTGTSMEPLLTAGDRVTVQPLSRTRADMKRGDLITFLSGEGVVVHRLIGKVSAGWDHLLPAIRRQHREPVMDTRGDRDRPGRLLRRAARSGGHGRPALEWVNPTIGMSRAAWFAFETILRKVKSAAIGNGRGGALASPAKRTLMSVFFPLSCGGFRFLVAKFGRTPHPQGCKMSGRKALERTPYPCGAVRTVAGGTLRNAGHPAGRTRLAPPAR